MDVTTAAPAAAPSAGAFQGSPTPAPSHTLDSVDVYSGMADKLLSDSAPAEGAAAPIVAVPAQATPPAPVPPPAQDAAPPVPAQADPLQALPAEDDLGRDEDLPADILANLKRIHPEARKQLRNAYFRDKALGETGMTVEHALRLKEMGFTPERALDTVKLFPTHDDALRAIQAAEERDRILEDFTSAPETFLSNLYRSDQAAHDRMARAIGQRLPELAPDVFSQHISRGTWNILDALQQQVEATDNADGKIALGIVREMIFPGSDGTRRPGQQGQEQINLPPHLQQELMEARQFKRATQESQQRQMAQRHDSFIGAVAKTANQSITSEIKKYVLSKDPSALSDAAIDKIVSEVATDVEGIFRTNPRLVTDLRSMVERGPMTQEHFNAVVEFVITRARGLVPAAAGPRITFYTKELLRKEQRTEAGRGAPVRRDVAAPAAAAAPARPTGMPMKGADYAAEFERMLG